ncbi:MAG TPA: ATP-binding protein [Actinomycetota bacterium]|nr:ATP-binding protein [Actinomycetota bacterium]
MPDVKLEIPPRTAYVGVVRLALASLARSAGFDEEAVDDIKIAVSEACANAVLASEQALSDQPVSVSWSEDDGECTIEVVDSGAPLVSVTDGDDSANVRQEMSLDLMRSLVAGFDLSTTDDGGNRAVLTISRPKDAG